MNMNKFCVLWFVSILLMSCAERNNSNMVVSIKDKVDYDVNIDNVDSIKKSMLEEQNYLYNNAIVIDTFFIVNDDSIKMQLNHHCLFDKKNHVSNKYTEFAGLNNFIGHNFESDLSIRFCNNTSTVKIVKDIFTDKVDKEILEQGQLVYPTIHFDSQKKLIVVGYSLSIPYTDVGLPVYVCVNLQGRKYVCN